MHINIKMENTHKYFDKAAMFFLCALIFFLPISKAAIQITVSLSILAFLGVLITNKFRNFPKTELNVPFLIFFVFVALSVVFAADFKTSLITFLKKYLEWFLLFFIVVATLNTKKRIKIFLTVLSISAACVALDGIFQQIFGFDLFRQHIYENRISASFNHYNDFAGYLAALLPIPLCLYLFENKRNKLSALLLVLLGYCLIMTLSRGGYLASFVIFNFLLVFSILKLKGINHRKIVIILIVFVNIAVLVSIIGIYKLPLDLVIERMRIEGSGRLSGGIWTLAISIFKSRPILGYGPGSFMLELGKINSYLMPTYAHNCYLQMLAEIGILGLASFIFIILRFSKMAVASIVKNNDFLLLGIFSGLLAYLVHAAFDTHFYSMQLSDFFWLMLGLAFAVVRVGPVEIGSEIKK